MNSTGCKKCLLSPLDDASIVIDHDGICNYCRNYTQENKIYFLSEAARNDEMNKLLKKIIQDGKNKQFDCVLGISGGVDSSYMVVKAVELGLRPLIVHYDNGWNSEQAVSNIEHLIQLFNLELYTYVNDWEEYKDIQRAFFKASVIDIELITDHGILALLYKQAKKHGVKYVLSGSNFSSESHLPSGWYHWKNDALNIKAIHRRYGTMRMKSFPYINFWNRIKNDKYGHIKFISMLDYLSYDKEMAKKELTSKFGWKDYGGKHFESVFTRFYQGYILPLKFGVDKRKAHLSSLICSGQISRDEALNLMNHNPYLEQQADEDKEYVLKKLGFSEEEFEAYMKQPIHSHFDYPSYITRHYRVLSFLSRIRKVFHKKKA